VDWLAWRDDVLAGRRVPTPDERIAYSVYPATITEVEYVLKKTAANKKASPLDDVSNDVLKRAGVADVLAAMINAVQVRPAKRVPRVWRDAAAAGAYKGKGKPVDEIESHRWICLVSSMMKVYEGWLLYRTEVLAIPDEGQTIGNKGVDVRMMLYVVVEVAAERRARSLETVLLVDDIVRGFPNATVEGTTLAIRREGLCGGILEGFIALTDCTRIVPSVGPGRWAEPVLMSFGHFEGSRTSPRRFGAQTRGALAAVRASPGALSVAGLAGGFPQVFVDDGLTLAESVEDAAAHLAPAKIGWAYLERHRHDLTNPDKFGIFRLGDDGSHEQDRALIMWAPRTGSTSSKRQADAMRCEHIEVGHDPRTLGYKLNPDAQFEMANICAGGEIGIWEAMTDKKRSILTVRKQCWMWDTFLRNKVEYNAALWATLDAGQEKDLEWTQTRALRAMIGNGTCRSACLPAVALRVLFGYDAMTARLEIARARFGLDLAEVETRSRNLAETRRAYVQDETQEPGARAIVIDHFRGLAERGAELEEMERDGAVEDDDERAASAMWASCTGATIRAVEALEALEEADRDEHGDRQTTAAANQVQGLDWPGEAETRARKAKAGPLFRKRAAKTDKDRLEGLSTAAMLRAFRPTPTWRKYVMMTAPAGDATGAYLALLAGCLRAAPLCRGTGNVWGTRRCACGYDGPDIDVHWFLGRAEGSVLECTEAAEARDDFMDEALAALDETGCFEVAKAAPVWSRESAAVLLGTPAELPRDLARHLPTDGRGYARSKLPQNLQIRLRDAFISTLGAWHARRGAARDDGSDDSDDEEST